MEIKATKKVESVLLTLETGEEFEVTVIRAYGEDSTISTNVGDALRILKENYGGRDKNPGCGK